MKRIRIFLFTAVLFCFVFACIVPKISFASESDEKNAKQQIDVYARNVSGNVACSTVPVINGKAQCMLEDGRTIIVIQAPDHADVLKVTEIPESETEAWNWIKSCLTNRITVCAVYDIYFEDTEGKRINADGTEIMLSTALYGQKVYSVSVDGQSNLLESTLIDGSVAFVADGSHYYVLTNDERNTNSTEEQKDDSGVDTEKPVETETDIDKRTVAVRTGDDEFQQISELVLLAVLVECALIFVKSRMRSTL